MTAENRQFNTEKGTKVILNKDDQAIDQKRISDTRYWVLLSSANECAHLGNKLMAQEIMEKLMRERPDKIFGKPGKKIGGSGGETT